MKRIIITVATTIALIIIAGVIYIYSGAYNISQVRSHSAVGRWIRETTKQHSIRKRIRNIKVPPMNDTTMLTVGFMHYNEMCVSCHGAPGIDPDELAEGLYPKPPKFYQSNDMPDTTEAFWIIKNGIEMTAMPAFGPTHSDDKIWAITDFLLNKMNKMSPQEYKQWQEDKNKDDSSEQ